MRFRPKIEHSLSLSLILILIFKKIPLYLAIASFRAPHVYHERLLKLAVCVGLHTFQGAVPGTCEVNYVCTCGALPRSEPFIVEQDNCYKRLRVSSRLAR